jgi:hypothetical protein
MPKRYNSEEENENQQNWSPIILKIEPIYTKINFLMNHISTLFPLHQVQGHRLVILSPL